MLTLGATILGGAPDPVLFVLLGQRIVCLEGAHDIESPAVLFSRPARLLGGQRRHGSDIVNVHLLLDLLDELDVDLDIVHDRRGRIRRRGRPGGG